MKSAISDENMGKERKKEELDYAVFTPTEDTLIKDTTFGEKLHVFEISKRISKYLSGLLFATGAISILMSAEYFVGAGSSLVFELRYLFLFVLSFVGAVNLICGLLLLSKE